MIGPGPLALPLADVAATIRTGRALAALVRGGDVIALVGELGAGKTTLTAALVAALGGGPAASPTFSLVHRYEPAGGLVVWHVDLYRIEHAAELPELGLDDAIGDPRGIVMIEWADKFDVLPRDHLTIALEHAPTVEGGRVLQITGSGPRSRSLAAELVAVLASSS
ncbi:MAG: tRNA (adenosine(37)-N6)-threonylcarbamoyltransferase complex ATPase subunit type 1 TsaE [Proteobacteria bacterium]|nr:tRNA (adenosine(37)-N6)-threonylcarbamoyltransferase complex ATPase subunit type 1 TsaE [Pseudomonadota bacterium]